VAIARLSSWLFFRVAHSSGINSDMVVIRALKNNQLTDGESYIIYGTGHWLDLFQAWLGSPVLCSG
jgi:hypothetical protein